jgi:hypothetical protein
MKTNALKRITASTKSKLTAAVKLNPKIQKQIEKQVSSVCAKKISELEKALAEAKKEVTKSLVPKTIIKEIVSYYGRELAEGEVSIDEVVDDYFNDIDLIQEIHDVVRDYIE